MNCGITSYLYDDARVAAIPLPVRRSPAARPGADQRVAGARVGYTFLVHLYNQSILPD